MAVPEKHKDMIRSILVKLGQDLKFDNLYPALEQRKMISKVQKERLQNPYLSPGDRRDALISDLMSGTSDTLRKFVECLSDTGQEGLVETIQQAAKDFDIPESEYMEINIEKFMQDAPTPPRDSPEGEEAQETDTDLKQSNNVLEDIPDTSSKSSSSSGSSSGKTPKTVAKEEQEKRTATTSHDSNPEHKAEPQPDQPKSKDGNQYTLFNKDMVYMAIILLLFAVIYQLLVNK